ncbi:chain-length determining protein [Catenovulum sp. SM1970]|uniref:XrtA system polysaccharide chain length determinant n=1 Tax=Marinifaba aquimaris TaxID=2741323 RepID=UPI001572193D|nr:XrtA system polysaccharide chain length determinant [Marinifaba aquimaris]NTS75959.1 chain-length determining protein [Marinifaba aquimaris]
MEEIQNTLRLFRQYLKGIWVKKRFIIISTWLICPIGFLLVSGMPDKYESSAKVHADTRSLLKPLLRGLAVQTNPDAEIKLIARTLLSRPNVEAIARETDLDIQATTTNAYESLIKSLQQGIKVKSAGRQNLYTISFLHQDPNVAEKVVTATLNKFVESTLGQNRQDSDTATKFLSEQIEEYVQRLEIAEKRLADFKRNYTGMLPGENSGYYSQVAALTKQVESVDLEIQEKRTMLDNVKKRIQSITVPSNTGSNAIQTQYDDRIDLLKANLDELLIRFTDNHPDVKETKRRLGYLEKQRQNELDALASVAVDGDIPTGQLSENVIVQQLSLQLSEIEAELVSLRVRKKRHSDDLAELNSKIDILPDIEAKLTALNRDYEITKNKYEELLNRRESAELSRKADQSAEDIQFKVIEPPRVPQQPTGPKRLIFYTLVLILGFGSGLAVAFVVSQINPLVTSIEELSKATGRPVFGFVSHVDIENIAKTNRKRMIVFVFSSLVILTLFLAFVGSEIVYSESLLKKSGALLELSRSILGSLL